MVVASSNSFASANLQLLVLVGQAKAMLAWSCCERLCTDVDISVVVDVMVDIVFVVDSL